MVTYSLRLVRSVGKVGNLRWNCSLQKQLALAFGQQELAKEHAGLESAGVVVDFVEQDIEYWQKGCWNVVDQI
jgi:hypothetical protein